MTYYLFIDESGDHGLTTLDPNFPIFLLCGVLMSDEDYLKLKSDLNSIKQTFWQNKSVILHSRDIRKCEKEFSLLFDLNLKKDFYENINRIVSSSNYVVFGSAINKNEYIKRFGKLSNDVYEMALSFIVERAVFHLDAIKQVDKKLQIIIEKRGKNEDKKLETHFQKLVSRGTGFVDASRLLGYGLKIHFKNKSDNINGLQFADLIAYPIARYIIEPQRANPAFDLIQNKIYTKNGKRYGLKKYP